MTFHPTLLRDALRAIRRVWRASWQSAASVIIILALIVSGFRLLLPQINAHRDWVEEKLGAELGQQVQIDTLKAQWFGWGPQLRVLDVRLFNSDGETTLRLKELRIEFDILRSILALDVVPRRMVFQGPSLSVIRHQDDSISVAGLQSAGVTKDAGADGPGSPPWLLRQRELELHQASILWQDRKHPERSMPVINLDLRIRNQGDRHLLNGNMTLPGLIGQKLRFAVDGRGNLMSRDWSGHIYVSTENLRLTPWLKEDRSGLHLDEGLARFRLWGGWLNGRLQSAEALVDISDLALAIKEQRLPLRQVQGHAHYQRRPDGWDLQVDRFSVRTDEQRWPTGSLHLASSLATAVAGPTWQARMSYLALDDFSTALAGLDGLPPMVSDYLRKAELSGELHNLDLDYRAPGAHKALGFRLNGEFQQLHQAANGTLPGFDGLAGRFHIDQDGGRAELQTSGAAVRLPNLFRQPLLTSVHGPIDWQRQDQGWLVQSGRIGLANKDIHGWAMGRIRLPAQGEPELFIFGDFRDGDGEAMPTYLPAHIMPTNLVPWLESAVVTGNVDSAQVLLHGRPGDFPYDGGEGRFEVRANVIDGILDFHPDWPRLEEVDAELVFRQRGMDITSSRGNLLGSDVLRVRTRIEDLLNPQPVIHIDGATSGSGKQALRFVERSPLKEVLGNYLPGSTIQGDLRVDLGISLPLYSGGHTRIDGQIRFQDNEIALGPLAHPLKKVNGRLKFSDGALDAKDIQANFVGEPVTLSANTDTTTDKPRTRIAMHGQLNPGLIRRLTATDRPARRGDILEELLKRTRGSATVQAELFLGEGGFSQAGAPEVVISSDLKGLALDLPAPLGKREGQARPLSLRTRLASDRVRRLSIDYSDTGGAVLAQQKDARGWRLTRGSVAIGDTPPPLPVETGIRAIARLDRLVADEWMALLPTSAATEQRPEQGPTLHSVELTVNEMDLYGQHLAGVSVSARPDAEDRWKLAIQSDKLQGLVHVPRNPGSPLFMDLEHLVLVETEADERRQNTNPATIPSLHIQCDALSFNGLELGRAELRTHPDGDAMQVDKLSLSDTDFAVEARGRWSLSGEKHQSHFQIGARSPDMGLLLDRFGYADSGIVGGDTELDIDAAWDGPPQAFNLNRLNGTLKLESLNGRLEDVSPGAAGRVFGLLSVAALPRRLRLDFSDLFKKGFSFDRIGGSFSIDSGQAYTNNLSMDAPSARIDIAGRVGLSNEDYDQTVTVTPDVSTTLPLAGALAGGPLGAAAALLAQTVFKSQINKALEFQYSITGKWQDPRIERLKGNESEDSG